MSYRSKAGIMLPTGTVIRGKWNGASYKIIKAIGHGANGSVFLAEKDGQPAAVKVCEASSDLALEFKVLSSLKKDSPSGGIGPYPIELDDWDNGTGTLFFYSMEYIQGEPIEQFIRGHGTEWTGVFLLQLLGDLEHLHKAGYCFGDLKADNLLVFKQEMRVRLVDFGGVTAMGKSVREFTEWYDRAYWNAGNRRADVSYDLFAAAQLLVKLSCPTLTLAGYAVMEAEQRKHALLKLLQTEKTLYPWRNVLQKAWGGSYPTARSMRDDIVRLQQEWLSKERKNKKKAAGGSNQKSRRKWDWTDWSILAASALAVSVLLRMFLP